MNSEVMGPPKQACCHQARPWIFPGRRPIFISARVHPGETPASYMLEGAAENVAFIQPWLGEEFS